jgi:hypothetical protein
VPGACILMVTMVVNAAGDRERDGAPLSE